MIKIAICDDEPMAVRDLSNLINMYAGERHLKIHIDSYTSGEEFLADMSGHSESPDIAFLDIKMQKINGIEAAKIIRETNETMSIIFISSLGEYVFDAFDVEAKGFY